MTRHLPTRLGCRRNLKRRLRRWGGKIVATETYTAGDQDYSAQLTTIRGSAPDVVFVPGVLHGRGEHRDSSAQAGLLKSHCWAATGGTRRSWERSRGKAIDGSFYSNHYSQQDPNPRVQDFIKKYKAKFGETPDGLAALGYDAARIMADAFGRASSTGGADVAAELAKTKD